MERRIFTNAELARMFATHNNVENFIADNVNNSEYLLSNKINLEPYDIENVSRPVIYYDFWQYTDGATNTPYWVYKGAWFGIEDITTENIYSIIKDRTTKKVSLRDIARAPLYPSDLEKEFDYTEETPNKIGTPTPKKIQSWFAYWDNYFLSLDKFKSVCINNALDGYEKIKSNVERIENIVMDKELNVPKSFIAYKNPLRIKCEIAYRLGAYYRSVEVDYQKLSEFLGF